MAEEFTPIESQDDFDSRISKRIERAQNAVRREYEGFEEYKAKAEKYDADIDGYKNQITSLTQQIAEQEARLQEYETGSVKTRIAAEFGIPAAMADRLTGTDEKSIRKDAEAMAGYFRTPYPKKASAASDIGGRDSALLNMFNNLKG